MSLRPQSSFSSDYATRGDAIMPAVIQGNGFNGRDPPIGGEDTYRLASLPSSFRPTDLVQLPVERCHYHNQLYLRREAAAALNNMISDAASQGLNLEVVSAYRDYGHQMRLYTQAVARGGEDQKNVARPGKSEHHLGTTVDLTNDESHALSRSFGDTAEGRWLAANASRYGWKMTVMSGSGRRSHNDEPWHLRYLGSSVNAPAGTSAIAQTSSQPQRRGILGSLGRLIGIGRH
jgi:D-alanyl-D-alanine carboxypeptidase